ncbi:chemotaxis protein CheB [Mucilaginibacter aquaedulcis]|uniref:chemotaxis protein CheB n=1 Tax=Mucilaginibacter aquaedulcis TaxID=1187081 RepID=UPI0025B41210|nr:chemotaxis protein CheB [Mucilaginibacter aquaedulcis]MDN3551184.1 chemotaxis protein CheB [Mucilaginibacter aquaedulcis]
MANKDKPTGFNSKSGKIVVVGTSAGGMSAAIKLLQQLPAAFPAPVLMVQHISGDATGNALLDALNKNCSLKCIHAVNGGQLEKGVVYLAPSDHHLMVAKSGRVLVTKGAQENRSRPAIDPLFRSAAVAFGNRVTGIILTGYLDDGTAGLIAIDRCGGDCIIQNPHDAEYPDMPQNALNQVKKCYCLPIAEMGGLLTALMSAPRKRQIKIPKDIVLEVSIAERVLSDISAVNALGTQVPFNCPGCGGVLWEIKKGPFLRYRCHTGHAYTASSLLAEQTNKIEETMWVALRMFEERRNLLTTLGKKSTGAAARSAHERATMSQRHIDRIRAILLSDDKATQGDSPA